VPTDLGQDERIRADLLLVGGTEAVKAPEPLVVRKLQALGGQGRAVSFFGGRELPDLVAVTGRRETRVHITGAVQGLSIRSTGGFEQLHEHPGSAVVLHGRVGEGRAARQGPPYVVTGDHHEGVAHAVRAVPRLVHPSHLAVFSAEAGHPLLDVEDRDVLLRRVVRRPVGSAEGLHEDPVHAGRGASVPTGVERRRQLLEPGEDGAP
jgi:hypothetical protein